MNRTSIPHGTRDDGAVVTRTSDFRTAAPQALPTAARGAVIIPAHNESAVISRTLRSLAPLVAVDGFEIIVACNGCTDDTAEIARRFAGVVVAETEQASKIAGLNLGDEAAAAWPRLYLDADIEVAPSTVLAVFEALAEPGVLAARPYYVYDTIGATAPVRAYYRARSRVPAPPSRLWGAGGYATTREGHQRFGRFPPVTADDSWFDSRFVEAEKRVVATAPMRVRTPRDLTGLLAVLTRQRRGYIELGISSHARSRGRGLLTAVRTPRDAVDVAWYVVLTVVSRRRAERILRRSQRAWERDASSRPTKVAAP
ncbi:hypothetical protein GCM10027053_03310 [Intrasporangium mesophilum]